MSDDDATIAEPAAAPEPAPVELVVLGALEARVLGCLVEKAATTPDVYPLTLNALQLACNQKTNRDPIMHADLGDVGHTLHTLEAKNLVRQERGARAVRYEHCIDAALNLTTRSRALIALMLLRGPQTQAELLTRSERLADFPDIESLNDTLDRLIARVPALAINIGRASGQREDRYMHLLSGPVSADMLGPRRAAGAETGDADSPDARGHDAGGRDLEARVAELERLVADLQARIETAKPD